MADAISGATQDFVTKTYKHGLINEEDASKWFHFTDSKHPFSSETDDVSRMSDLGHENRFPSNSFGKSAANFGNDSSGKNGIIMPNLGHSNAPTNGGGKDTDEREISADFHKNPAAELSIRGAADLKGTPGFETKQSFGPGGKHFSDRKGADSFVSAGKKGVTIDFADIFSVILKKILKAI